MMPRTHGGRTADAIREAAARLFLEHGYEATSLREIAAEVGIQVGSLYNHIESKGELLRNIMLRIMDDLLEAMEAATRDVEDPVERLAQALDCHIRFHATHSREVFISNTEVRSLSAEDQEILIAQRDQFERLLLRLVHEACDQGRGDVIDAHLQTYAIVAIGTHVAAWYRDEGPMSLDDVVEAYTATIMRQLGIRVDQTAVS